MHKLNLYNAHCCGEIGDVIVAGNVNLRGKNTLEKSKFLYPPITTSPISPQQWVL